MFVVERNSDGDKLKIKAISKTGRFKSNFQHNEEYIKMSTLEAN